MALAARCWKLPIAAMDEACESRIDAKPYPLVRLDQAPIHY
jgi:hypothetical protein